jgi:hypothetical protein
MADIPISAFNDLYEAVEAYSDLTVVYRGVRSSTHQLVPKSVDIDISTPEIG